MKVGDVIAHLIIMLLVISYSLRVKLKITVMKKIMNAQEIRQAAEMYNKIMEALEECEKVNKANNYDGDLLWVDCNGGTHYTNELGDIILDPWTTNKNEFYSFGTMEETAAKYAELCLAAGCEPSDIYTSY